VSRPVPGLLAALALCAVLVAAACSPPPMPAPHYGSADKKSIEDLMQAYVAAWNARDEKAILRLYAADARMVARLALNRRVLAKKDLAANLGYILAEQARAGLVLELQKPLLTDVRGESATAKALLRLAYRDKGQPAAVLVDLDLALRREQFFWKIVRELPQPVGAVTPEPPGP
jgi:ketosteroid isomerase-like protein